MAQGQVSAKGSRVRSAGTHFHVIGLQQGATAVRPIGLQGEDNLLKCKRHDGCLWFSCWLLPQAVKLEFYFVLARLAKKLGTKMANKPRKHSSKTGLLAKRT